MAESYRRTDEHDADGNGSNSKAAYYCSFSACDVRRLRIAHRSTVVHGYVYILRIPEHDPE